MDRSPIAGPRFISPDLHPQLGGPFKSVGLFQRALGGRILTLTRQRHFERLENFDYVHTSQQYWYGAALRKEAAGLCQGATLLSCHLIFRYQNQLVMGLAKRMKIPYWAVPHGSMDPWVFSYGRLQKALWYKFFGERYFRDARMVILATERERDKMAQRYGGDNMRVVYWPVEALDVSEREQERARMREAMGIAPEAKIILYFGRYHSMKRPVETLNAFHRARLGKDTHLVMVGIDNDVSREQLLAIQREKSVANAHILGPVYGEERLRLLLAADVYVSLSFRENFNHTAAESMSAGQAVILSPGNDLQYSFPRDTDFGWCLKSDSEEEWIGAFEAVDAASEQEIRKKGEAARNWCLDALSFQRFRDRLKSLYQEST